MKNITYEVLAMVIGLSLSGCATNKGRQFTQSDGLIDLAMTLSGHEQIDVYPVERVSTNGLGEIATAHARKDAHGIFVSGSVEKGSSLGWVTTAWSHIDVVVLDSKGRVAQGIATSFFPSAIPSSQRGMIGRSRYSVRLADVPPSGSTIKVGFHHVPKSQCEFDTRS